MAVDSETQSQPPTDIRLIAQESFGRDGDYHRLVTFLNQCLKDRDLIFGLSKDGDQLCLKVYEVRRGEGTS